MPCFSEGLECYKCTSDKSWDACEKKVQRVVCLTGHDEVCIKQRIVQNDDSTDKGYTEWFIRMCGKARLCSVKDCEEEGKTCQIDCCHNDLCNTGSTPAANSVTTLMGGVVVILISLLQWCCAY